jgi:hypothetical protein
LLYVSAGAAYLHFLNVRKSKARMTTGKAAVIIDSSMKEVGGFEQVSNEASEKNAGVILPTSATTACAAEDPTAERKDEEEVPSARLGQQAFSDLTDWENDEFIYVL